MIVKKYEDLSNKQIHQIFQARSEVFVVEQECVYQDVDNKDRDAYHCFIMDENDYLIAYLRILNKGVSYKDAPSIGRVLVTSPYRKKEYGKAIMTEAIQYLFDVLKETKIIISAQQYLTAFYTSFGFKQVGDAYLEDNIPHIEMVLMK